MFCTDVDYKYYAVDNSNKLVFGFDDEWEVQQYCKEHKLKKFTRNGLKNKKINPNDNDNWTSDYPKSINLKIE